MSDPVANAAHRARSAPPPISPWKERLGRWDYKASPYAYIAPFFIVFAIVGLFPLLYTAYVSLHDWDLISGQGDFVGLGNFTFVLSRPVFWVSLGNTLSIFVLSTVPQIAIALVLASVLNANIRAKTFWRMGVLLPYVVAPVAVTLIFSRLFADQSGLVNAVLELVGADAIGWHRDSLPAHVAIATMVNFRWTGFNTLVLLAAMRPFRASCTRRRSSTVPDGSGSSCRSRSLPYARPSSSSPSRPPSAVSRSSTNRVSTTLRASAATPDSGRPSPSTSTNSVGISRDSAVQPPSPGCCSSSS